MNHTGHVGAGSNAAIQAAASRAIGATLEVSLRFDLMNPVNAEFLLGTKKFDSF